MERLKFSRHLLEERADRAAFILIHTGLGNIVYSAPAAENRTAYITDEGVIYFKGADGVIVTMYYLEIDQARYFCKEEKIPEKVKHAIERNRKRGYIEKQNQVKY